MDRYEENNLCSNVCAVVVTHNRPMFLERCLNCLNAQSQTLNVLVVDNASDEETTRLLNKWMREDKKHRSLIRSKENIGGAGGFALGLAKALEYKKIEWVWLLDDDAYVEPDALERLIDRTLAKDNVYGSVAVGYEDIEKHRLCWIANGVGSNGQRWETVDQLGSAEEVRSLPFLGFLVSRKTVDTVGLPDASFFLCADDVEYSARIRAHGGRLILVKDSIIRHAMPKRRMIELFGKRFDFRYQTATKTYYEARNKIRVARRYWPGDVWIKTLPGLFLRLFAGLIFEDRVVERVRMFFLGCWDGFRDVGGRREGV